jgi:LysM repeat protein
LGRHSKQSRIKLPSGVTVAAAPTIAGVAAAFCLTPSASASAVQAANAAHTTAMPVTTGVASAAEAKLAAANAVAAKRAASALPTAYKVRAGDSLSSIAARVYHNRAAWTVLYWRNRQHIHWADQIYVGQVLQVPPKPARLPAAPTALGPAPAPAAPSGGTAPAQATPAVGGAASAYAGGVPGGAFGACVVARESGGNAQIMNASGHYGLYQFSAATWAAYGGNPADFGHASVAEQNQVFANALAAGGQSNWAPYDGC